MDFWRAIFNIRQRRETYYLKREEVNELPTLIDILRPDLIDMCADMDRKTFEYRESRDEGDRKRAAGSVYVLAGLVAAPLTLGASLLFTAKGAHDVFSGVSQARIASAMEDKEAKQTLARVEEKYSSVKGYEAVDVFIIHGIRRIQCRIIRVSKGRQLRAKFPKYEPGTIMHTLSVVFDALYLPAQILELLEMSWNLFFGSSESQASKTVRSFVSDLDKVKDKINRMEDEITEFAEKVAGQSPLDWDIEFDKKLFGSDHYGTGTVNVYV